jgi:hypothetical protein
MNMSIIILFFSATLYTGLKSGEYYTSWNNMLSAHIPTHTNIIAQLRFWRIRGNPVFLIVFSTIANRGISYRYRLDRLRNFMELEPSQMAKLKPRLTEE